MTAYSPQSGASVIAEDNPKFKIDVNLAFGARDKRKFVLRTTFNSESIFKTRYPSVAKADLPGRARGRQKDAAVIEGEIWVFGVDATNSDDLVVAVTIAANAYKTDPEKLFGDVFMKNLNAEGESSIVNSEYPKIDPEYWKPLVKANKSLYQKTTEAVIEAARKLGVTGQLQMWVFSNNANPKIPKKDLHQAMKDGGLKNIATSKEPFEQDTGSNDGLYNIPRLKNHLHMGSINL